MIAWGVKLKKEQHDDMQIVSNMAQAHSKVVVNRDNEIYKLDILDSGEPIILDGPLVAVDPDGHLYGMPSIAGHVISQFVAGALMLVFLVLLVAKGGDGVFLGWIVSTVMWLKVANDLKQALDERIKYIRKFLADFSDEIDD